MNPMDFQTQDEIAWCPGCGDFGILSAVKNCLAQLGREPRELLLVSGIGQAAKLPHYIKANCFNGLHGRALPIAFAAKAANRKLTVLVTTGDGDCYGEGGNHFMHNIRRNPDITVLVHNNQIYGLTKGQASPTTDAGHVTKVQEQGVILEPVHPLELAIALGAGFVARGYSREIDHLAGLLLAGINYPGFALIDVLQPCVSFNKINTYGWYEKRVYQLENEPDYDCTNKAAAYQKAAEWGEKIPIGIIYQKPKSSYEMKSRLSERLPLVEEPVEAIDINHLVDSFRA